MAFVKPSVNKINADISKLTIYMRSTEKWGKSTLFRDLIIEKFGNAENGMLVQCGSERGAKLLDNLNTTSIKNYKDAMELRDWVVNNKDEHDIRIICFDTLDELFPIFEEETIRQSNRQNPSKPVKTINQAMGGFQAGQQYTADEVKKYFDSFTEAGIGLFAISHTKYKTIKDKGDVEDGGYLQLTSNLVAAYETMLSALFDMVVTGTIDRAVEEEVDSTGKVKRKATDSVRKLYFRATTSINAGGRIAYEGLPEFMVFDKSNMAADFIKVVEDGIEASKTTNGNTTKKTATTKKKVEPVVEEEPEDDFMNEPVVEAEPEEEIDDLFAEDEATDEDDYPSIEEMRDEIKNSMKSLKANDAEKYNTVAKTIKENGSFSDCPDDVVKQLYDLIKE